MYNLNFHDNQLSDYNTTSKRSNMKTNSVWIAMGKIRHVLSCNRSSRRVVQSVLFLLFSPSLSIYLVLSSELNQSYFIILLTCNITWLCLIYKESRKVKSEVKLFLNIYLNVKLSLYQKCWHSVDFPICKNNNRIIQVQNILSYLYFGLWVEVQVMLESWNVNVFFF